jgi:hypothetical protein
VKKARLILKDPLYGMVLGASVMIMLSTADEDPDDPDTLPDEIDPDVDPPEPDTEPEELDVDPEELELDGLAVVLDDPVAVPDALPLDEEPEDAAELEDPVAVPELPLDPEVPPKGRFERSV